MVNGLKSDTNSWYRGIVSQPAITCSKLINETLEQGLKYVQSYKRRYWHCSGVIIANSEHISHIVLVLLLLTLSR